MKKSKAVIMLLRLPFLTVTLGGVLLGASFAYWDSGKFNIVLFLLTLFGAFFMHIACNVANDYFDFKSGTDAANTSAMSPFSGGSRMIIDGHVTAAQALTVSIVFSVLGGGIGLYLNSVSPGNSILLIGIAAVFFIYGYNGFPLYLVRFGLGEVAIFLAWGPLMVLGAYYVQVGSISGYWPLAVSIPSGILTTLVLLINEFADHDADRLSGRKTWVILLGYRGGLKLYLGLALACYIVVATGVVAAGWPIISLAVFLTLPVVFKVYSLGISKLNDWPSFLQVVQMTILLNLVFLLILSVCFLI